jgi:hypothetical protein
MLKAEQQSERLKKLATAQYPQFNDAFNDRTIGGSGEFINGTLLRHANHFRLP